MRREKIPEIDFQRAISALAVITIHVTAKYTGIHDFGKLQLSLAFIDNVVGFAVPSFVFISGLVLYRNYNVLQGSVLTFYKKRFARVIPVYLLFSLFYILYSSTRNFTNFQGISHISFGSVMFKLFTGGACSHLWYFGILFQFYLLYPLLLKLYKKYELGFVVFCMLLQVCWSFLDSSFFKTIGSWFGNPAFHIPFAFTHICWFVFGFYFFDHRSAFLHRIQIGWGLVIVLILNVFKTLPLYCVQKHLAVESIIPGFFLLNKLLLPIVFLVEIKLKYKVSVLLLEKVNSLSRLLRAFGDYSLEIYLIHAYAIVCLVNAISYINIRSNQILFYPIVWLGTVLVSLGFAITYRWIKMLLKGK